MKKMVKKRLEGLITVVGGGDVKGENVRILKGVLLGGLILMY